MATTLDIGQELVNDLRNARNDLKKNISYYEAEYRPETVGLAVPPEMRSLLAAVGWGRMYVRSIEERLDIEGFRLAGSDSADDRLWSWWQANNLDTLSGFAHNEALIHGRAYIVVSHPDPNDKTVPQGTPQITVESAVNMWADIHPVTGKVTQAVRIRKVNENTADFDFMTVYLPNSTTVYQLQQNGQWKITANVRHNLGAVPVVAILNRARLTDIYGNSEITTELRSCIDAASRTMMNMQATAELMALPQRLLFGVDPEKISDNPENLAKTFKAYMAHIMAFEDEGKAQQFTAAELRNFTEVLDQIAKMAASYTGLPMGYFSLATDNPASAEAVRESEKRLVKLAERKQRLFGEAWEQAMRLAFLIMDGSVPEDAFKMETIWRNPATPTYAAMADAAVKLATSATPDGRTVIPVERARIDLGYSDAERKQMEEWDRASASSALAELVRRNPAPSAPQFSDNPNPEDAER